MQNKICLVGIGPHAKRIYLEYFKKYSIMPTLIIELSSAKKKTLNILKENNWNSEIFLINDEYKNLKNLPNEAYKKLKEKVKNLEITHAIISTEPKGHNMYLNFFLRNNIHTLSDKPITVSEDMLLIKNIKGIKNDFYKLLALQKRWCTM